jgi:hypothetical protein
MIRRWHHGHSLGSGVLVGLIIARRPELVFAAGFAAGILLMYARTVAHWLAVVLEDSRRRFIRRVAKTAPVPVYRVPREKVMPDDGEVPF